MSTIVNTGWLKDDNGEKFAPKTLSSQIVTNDGTTLESKILKINDSTVSTVDTWSSKKISDELANAGGVSSWNDLTDKPTIPTKTSQLTNDSGYLTSIPNEYVTESELIAKGYATTSQVDSLTEEIDDLKNNGTTLTEKDKWITDRIISIAHRGAMPTETPENTLVAYAKAKEMGFDYIEVDIRTTSDGEIVMSHDATINRMGRNADGTTISNTINIADITLEELKNYVFCGTLYNSFPTVKIPTLEETVALCRSVGIGIHFDMYVEPTTTLLDKMFSILDKYGMRNNVIWGSSTYSHVYAIKNYYSKANIYTRSSTYNGDIDAMLSGLNNLKTGENHVVVAVRLESMQSYAPLLRENGYDVIYITPTKEQFISVYSYVTAVMSEDYVASDYLIEYLLGGGTSNGGTMEDVENGGGSDEPTAFALNLNRVKGTNWYSDTNYLNPVDYTGVQILNETECGISNLAENSITVTENGKGGRGVVFPLVLKHGKTYTLNWNATGTTDTRFRLMTTGGGTIKTFDLDNKKGTVTSATIVLSADGKTITVNGTSQTFSTDIAVTALHFSAATSKTVSYTGVVMTEN